MFSKKATRIEKIFTVDLTFTLVNFCGLLKTWTLTLWCLKKFINPQQGRRNVQGHLDWSNLPLVRYFLIEEKIVPLNFFSNGTVTISSEYHISWLIMQKQHCQIILFSLKIGTESMISNKQVCFDFVKKYCTNDL